MFRLAWPDDIKELLHNGNIKNSNFEMAGLLILWLVMDEVCPELLSDYIALFSDKYPTIGWVKRLAER